MRGLFFLSPNAKAGGKNVNAKNKLEDLDIYEVSLVGSPANWRRYLLVKS